MYTDRVEVSGIVDSIEQRSRWHRTVYSIAIRQTLGDDSRCIPIRMFGGQGRKFAEQAPPGTPVAVVAHLDAFEWERGSERRWLTNIDCDPSELTEDSFTALPAERFPDPTPPSDEPAEPEDIPF